MTLRLFGFSLFSFVLGVALVTAITPNVSTANTQDDRAADREAIRAHVRSIAPRPLHHSDALTALMERLRTERK